MPTSEPRPGERVKEVHFTEDAMSVDLADGRTIRVLARRERSRYNVAGARVLLCAGEIAEEGTKRP